MMLLAYHLGFSAVALTTCSRMIIVNALLFILLLDLSLNSGTVKCFEFKPRKQFVPTTKLNMLGPTVAFVKSAVKEIPQLDHPESVSNIGVDIAKLVMTSLQQSSNPTVIRMFNFWETSIPPFLQTFVSSIYLGDLLMFALFQVSYRSSLKLFHRLQIVGWKILGMGSVPAFNKSILGFLEERAGLLAKIMGCNYLIKLGCLMLGKLGFVLRPDLPILLSKVIYTLYISHFVDLFKSRFINVFLPNLGMVENRRQSYVLNRSLSVIIWVVGVLVVCEMVSTYLKVPLSSTLAFGG